MKDNSNLLAIALEEIEPKATGHCFSFRLKLSNVGGTTLLLPFPTITSLQLTEVDSERKCQWFSNIMLNGSSRNLTIAPDAEREFELHARFRDSLIEIPAYDMSDFGRWCTDVKVGRYIAQYQFSVDEDYFAPDSHARLRHLQADAESQDATAWTGVVESAPIHMERWA